MGCYFFPQTSMEEFSFYCELFLKYRCSWIARHRWRLFFGLPLWRGKFFCHVECVNVVMNTFHLKVKINVWYSDWRYSHCHEGDFPSTNQQIASFPHGMKLDVFVCTEIPRDQVSFRVLLTYKGVGNYKYRAVINRMDSLRAGWIMEDICESVCLCIPWALVSVPMTCPASFLPSLCPCVHPFLRSAAGLIEQKPVWHGSNREIRFHCLAATFAGSAGKHF